MVLIGANDPPPSGFFCFRSVRLNLPSVAGSIVPDRLSKSAHT
ncbi:hypothetical protein X759_10525 [Mesorhizobium sp. LSHC420B00]|nr:hypothetical protein X759_10525 [Mesorhizobium sp. LSHC420B00]